MKGLVAFSFALGAEEPNPCNVRLAEAVKRIVEAEGSQVVVVAQWEVARALETLSCQAHHIVYSEPNVYLNSDMVMTKAADWFHGYHITEVIPVAQPFLHLPMCRQLVRRHSFTVLKRRVGWIGFYGQSLQWWTRDPIRLLFCAILFKLTGHRFHIRKEKQ